MASIFIITFGCTANQDNASIMKGILKKHGHCIASNPKDADVIIINTCIVKGVTVNKVKSTIEKYRNKKLIIAGCMPEAEKKLLNKLVPKASLINTFHVTEINNVVANVLKNKRLEFLGKRLEEKLALPKSFNGKVSIQIAEGCCLNCSFCLSKLAKGNIKSFSESHIIKELKSYIKKGHKLINITSTDNGCYGFDKKTNLPMLLKKLVLIPGDFKLRIGMMNPQHVKTFLKELIQVYKNPKIIKFLHIPVQSGSNSVLKDMQRHNTIEDFKNIASEFRKAIPGMTISTDIIVGYPTESIEDFNKTIQLIKETRPEVLNVSKFTPHHGTTAAKLKQLKTETIKERSIILTKEYKKEKVKSSLN